MIWKNTLERYGVVAKSFHWTVAVLVLGMLALGLYMTGLDISPFKFKLYFWHKSVGATILILMTLRLLWKLSNMRPAPLPSHEMWERALAKLIHALLYVCLFTMPLSGWVMSSAKGIAISVFGWFTLPAIVAENKALAHWAVQVHNVAAWVLIGCIVLHLSGALKHHFIDKDSTLRRMFPFAKVALTTLAFVGLLSGAAWASDPVQAWTIDPAQSHLTFEGTQMGAPFTGEFKKFGGTILFDPARLAENSATIAVDMTSFDTKSPERDDNLKTSPWFFIESFPESKFTTDSFEKTGDDKYIAHGKLTIRDVTLPVDLPFTLTITPNTTGHKTAKMEG
ncbi:MAG TPA: cytochrome b/b6 domain-containing protein, partial [Micavibrio sp.]